jgi:hypothetical protein
MNFWDMLVLGLGLLIPEFPGQACPEPWLNELTPGPGMSALISGLN